MNFSAAICYGMSLLYGLAFAIHSESRAVWSRKVPTARDVSALVRGIACPPLIAVEEYTGELDTPRVSVLYRDGSYLFQWYGNLCRYGSVSRGQMIHIVRHLNEYLQNRDKMDEFYDLTHRESHSPYVVMNVWSGQSRHRVRVQGLLFGDDAPKQIPKIVPASVAKLLVDVYSLGETVSRSVPSLRFEVPCAACWTTEPPKPH